MSKKAKTTFYKILVILSATMIGIHGGLILLEYKIEGDVSDKIFSFGSIIAMFLILVTSISQWRRYYRLDREQKQKEPH